MVYGLEGTKSKLELLVSLLHAGLDILELVLLHLLVEVLVFDRVLGDQKRAVVFVQQSELEVSQPTAISIGFLQ